MKVDKNLKRLSKKDLYDNKTVIEGKLDTVKAKLKMGRLEALCLGFSFDDGGVNPKGVMVVYGHPVGLFTLHLLEADKILEKLRPDLK